MVAGGAQRLKPLVSGKWNWGEVVVLGDKQKNGRCLLAGGVKITANKSA